MKRHIDGALIQSSPYWDKESYHVGYIGGLLTNYAREVSAGILDYAGRLPRGRHWRVTVFHTGSVLSDTTHLLANPPDGLIVQAFGAPLLDLCHKLQRPWVNVGSLVAADVPTVVSDNSAIGRLGAKEFLRQGLKHFLFVGNGLPYSDQRRSGFAQGLNDSGYVSAYHRLDAQASWYERTEALAEHLDSLRRAIEGVGKPLGVMGHNDEAASMVIEVCRGAGWHVPEQVAVLGVDNNEMNCEASRPTLSSVQPAAEAIGRQAAELLERLLEGHPADSHIEISPVGVVTRMSTELTAVSDPIVATALSFIKSRAHESISVDDVAEHVGVSKRTLQTRFRVGLDLTVAGEIRKRRFDRARDLLRSTDWPVARVAAASGFSSSSVLANAFRREMGEAPLAYRKRTAQP